ECCKALSIWVPLAAEIEFWLISDADEKLVGGGVHGVTGHRDGAVAVRDAGLAGSLERDRRKELLASARVCGSLDDRNLHRLLALIVGADGAMKEAAVVQAGVGIFEKVRGGGRRPRRVDLHFDFTEISFHDDTEWRLGRGERK